MSAEQVSVKCPLCGRPMAERVNRVNLSAFLGCTGYPDLCSHTEKLPEYIRLKRAGATQLPGFE